MKKSTTLFLGAAITALSPAVSSAQIADKVSEVLPVEMSMTSFLIIGALLLTSLIFFFLFQQRFNAANRQLKDVSNELGNTRERLTETSQTLKKSEQNLKQTTTRYQNILFEAEVGMFQMDLAGNCTYVNSALQTLSGLYPKKALKEGLQSAIHPDDRAAFSKHWKAFIKGNTPFSQNFRFKGAKGQETHVACRANKVLNAREEVESYIGWISDVTAFHEIQLQEESKTARHARFVEETVEGYYHLESESPIPINPSADKMAETIMEKMELVDCSETFAALLGSTASDLIGKKIGDLHGGCGPFKNNESLKKLITAEYKLIDFESVRQDPRGNRLNLVNNVIGLVENKQLISIRGAQRNISQQRREHEELTSQTQFMHRILDALPADVHVKDTRCRYLYASQKLADRTGIPQESWLGKTIFEVMPATPRDHDKNAITVMKSGNISRIERPYEARKKSGWMETIQIPLVSSDGLVEGTVGLSFEISERKERETKAKNERQQLEQHLKGLNTELEKSKGEHAKSEIALRDTHQKLSVREAELNNRQHEFKEQLAERKRTEDLLRRNETTLLTNQKNLEEQLSSRLADLESETDKRKKWEELIEIKENELRKIEAFSDKRGKQLEEQIASHKQAESLLGNSQTELRKVQQELDKLEQDHQQEKSQLTETQDKKFSLEHAARRTTENKLDKSESLLRTAQERIQVLTGQHATELEHEIAERKTATAKLIQNTEELDELKQQFSERIEQETKGLKLELAKKQIREKALRQQEKDRDARIKELEKSLESKAQENSKQIQAREGAEVQRENAEQKLEQLNTRQEQLVERKTQKLNLNIAEIRLEEIRLRKTANDLQQEKEELQEQAKAHAAALAKSAKEQKQSAATLSKTEKHLEQMQADQSLMISKETQALNDQLQELKQVEADLRKQDEGLKKQGVDLQQTIDTLSTNLKTEADARKGVEKERKDLQHNFDASQNNTEALIEKKTVELNQQIEAHKKNEIALQKVERTLKKQAETLQGTLDARNTELAESQKGQTDAEQELAETIKRSGQDAQGVEAEIAKIKKGNLEEIQRVKDEQKELRQKEKYYRTLFQSSADAFLQIDSKTGKIGSVNLAAARLFGEETTKTLLGKTFEALSPATQSDKSSSVEAVQEQMKETLKAGHSSFEWQFQKADKATFYGLVSLSTIQVEERSLILAVVNDISNLRQRQTALQQSLTEAQAANQTNSKTVDEVAETIQTTLAPVVQSIAAIGAADNLTDDQKLNMTVINRNCRNLIDTMNYRKELSHLADGSDALTSSTCNLHELIHDLDQQFSPRAETKKLFFAVSYAQYQSAHNLPKLVEADDQKLRKVLSLLLGYALAHTDKGRLGLHAAHKSEEGESISVTFELAYTGKGKEDERLSGIFGTENSTAEDMQYGLSLAQRHAQMMGGKIGLEYRSGGVTALTVTLPFKKVISEIVMPAKDIEPKAGAA